MKLTEGLLKSDKDKPSCIDDAEIKRRFRILLRKGVEIATRNGHNMRIEEIKLEDTHMWARLICKDCGGLIYLDADQIWDMDKIFGTAAMIQCKR